MTRLRTVLPVLLLAACGHARSPYATTGKALDLSRVVLYRNGVGYFERGGHVDGDKLVLRVRKDQVNDLLKSLTVVEKSGGRAVSISMPLDPRAWSNAAIATLGPGAGSLAEVLDRMRGTEVTLKTSDGSETGRIMLVETIGVDAPGKGNGQGEAHEQDFKVTLIDGGKLRVVRLSKVEGITLHNSEISMQFSRSLDATAGEGMFQQVDVTIRLTGKHAHDLVVSYVVGAPMWKPTYRVVLPESGKGQALLQGWAVVDNTTGEDWRDVNLALTSGSPIAFRYDLHTPRDVARTDLSSVGSSRSARVSVGETGYAPAAPASVAQATPPPPPKTADSSRYGTIGHGSGTGSGYGVGGGRGVAQNRPATQSKQDKKSANAAPANGDDYYDANEESEAGMGGMASPDVAAASAVDAEALASSMSANSKASNVSGLSRYDLGDKLTIPDGTSTMVAIINQQVEGEETFLFKPGGAGSGYEANPYRVIRFKNSTPFALESGPISIYSGGSFVGEGISEPVSAGVPVTIPFAVESGIMVESKQQYAGDEMRLVKIVRGVIEVESFSRRTTTWHVHLQQPRKGKTLVYIRHGKAGGSYELTPRPAGTEDLPDAYLIPVEVADGGVEQKQEVVEQTPSRTQLSIWDNRALVLFEGVLAVGNLDPAIRAKLDPIVKLRQEIGKIDTQIEGTTHQRVELDNRAGEIRANLMTIQKDTSASGNALRKQQTERLSQIAKDTEKLARDLVEMQTKRTEKKIALEDLLQNLELNPKEPIAPKK